NSVRTQKAKTKIAFFQPLTLLDMVVYYQRGRDIHRISEIKCSQSFHSIPFDIRKTAVALFITEMLGQVLKEEDEPLALFQFLHESIGKLDDLHDNFQDFHLRFFLELSEYLGIRPDSGLFMLSETGRPLEHNRQLEEFLDWLLNKENTLPGNFNRNVRLQLLQIIVDYYRIQYDSIKPMKSIEILREVFE
ncbi:MAG TPA: DNA repair protein RecO C-terminal domain-containing protein, partial [Candidatus Limnocylindrales bacterium]|nr:DNA repair protein RecO C-terminal domain-containing protein [Candidatus Limnocylindrales bacterium]